MQTPTVPENIKNSYSYKLGWNKVGATLGDNKQYGDFPIRAIGTTPTKLKSKSEVKQESDVFNPDVADIINQTIAIESAVLEMKKELVRVKNSNPNRAREIFLKLKEMGKI